MIDQTKVLLRYSTRPTVSFQAHFEDRPLTRNLKPYSLAPYVDPNQVAYPTVLTDSAVVNAQPDPFEYGIAVFNDRASRFNVYSPDTPFQYNTQTVIKESQFEPYPNFDASFYEPVDILYKPDPLGSNGLLSSDSFIAKLGAVQLKKAFEDRIATEIYQRTQARINAFGANSGSNLFGVLTNRIPLIEPNYQITVPGNPVIAAVDLATRLSGSYFPVSPIPGSYWDTEIRLGQPTTIQQIKNAFNFVTESGVGKFFARLLGSDSGSQKFLSNTGSGQRTPSRAHLLLQWVVHMPRRRSPLCSLGLQRLRSKLRKSAALTPCPVAVQGCFVAF